MRVAVLGTGIMGLPMAHSVLRTGHEVVAWNRTLDKAGPLGAAGAELAASPAEAVRDAEIILTILADADAVTRVVTGEQGALAAAADDAVWLQMSSIGVPGIERCMALAHERDIALVDAPVFGSKGPAESGTLTVLAAGPDEALDRCAPVFDAVGTRTIRLGAAGAATRLKVVANSWVIALVQGVAETISLAEAAGVDPARFLALIAGGPVDSGYAQSKGRAMIERDFTPMFPLGLAQKDAELALELARSEGLELPSLAAVASQMARAVAMGHQDEDIAATIHASLKRSGDRPGEA